MDGDLAIGARLIWEWNWSWPMLITAVLVTAAYVQGWRNGARSTVLSWRIWLPFSGGLLLLAVAVFSPLDQLARHYFFFHVLQQLLLVGWIPALLLAADPLPLVWRGLPKTWQKWIRFLRKSLSGWEWVAGPGSAYLIFTAVYWLWYDPTLHHAALSQEWVWEAEKVTLLGAALLYWRHITGAKPRRERPLPPLLRAFYTLIGAWPIKLAGIVVLFSGGAFYDYPGAVTMPGLSSIAGSQFGSMLVWSVGGLGYTITAFWLVRRWLVAESQKPPLPVSSWSTGDAMRAPGLDS